MFSLPKPVYLLALATSALMLGTPVAVLIGGLVGQSLSPSAALATFPVAAMVIGVALGALPAASLLNRFGYKVLFACSAAIAITGALTAIGALLLQNFVLWTIALAILGHSAAYAQQLRFAATMFSAGNPSQIPQVLSTFMLAGVIAAVIGPELATAQWHAALPAFASGFIGVIAIIIAAVVIVAFMPNTPDPKSTTQKSTAPSLSPKWLAILASVTAYGIMSFVMTATPLSMHEHHGHSLNDTKAVIQWHILAMFLPSLITGKIIQKFGAQFGIILGSACYIVAAGAALSGIALPHYASALILLGVGWNLLFTSGSTLAAQQTAPMFKGQHDTWVFSVQALVSLAAGVALFQLGWQAIQWLAIAGTLPILAGLLYLRSQGLARQTT